MARRASVLLLTLAMAHALQQALQGVMWSALVVTALSLAGAATAWCWLWRSGRAPRTLRLMADGSLAIQAKDGSWRLVHLQSGCIRLGGWLLLHLAAADRCSFRVVLGPDNLDAPALAALHRRLRRPPTVAGPLR